MEYIFSIPLIYIGLWIFFTILKASSQKLEKLIFCSVCFAWATHLILAFIFSYPMEITTFMLGMTITGIAYKIQEKRNVDENTSEIKQFLTNFFVMQLLFTIIGLAVVLAITQ